MSRLKLALSIFLVISAIAGLTAGVPLVATAADPAPATSDDHAGEAAVYEKEGAELEAKSQRHADLAKRYDARATGGSKQATALRSIAAHCRELARLYGAAAAEARAMAKSHREMAGSS